MRISSTQASTLVIGNLSRGDYGIAPHLTRENEHKEKVARISCNAVKPRCCTDESLAESLAGASRIFVSK